MAQGRVSFYYFCVTLSLLSLVSSNHDVCMLHLYFTYVFCMYVVPSPSNVFQRSSSVGYNRQVLVGYNRKILVRHICILYSPGPVLAVLAHRMGIWSHQLKNGFIQHTSLIIFFYF